MLDSLSFQTQSSVHFSFLSAPVFTFDQVEHSNEQDTMFQLPSSIEFMLNI